MSLLFIGLLLILISNFYGPALRLLTLKSSVKTAFAFIIVEFLLASIGIYFFYENASQSEIIVIALCALGAIVRVGYAHFKSTQSQQQMIH